MSKKDIINRLRRVEGQVRGLQKMIDEERACSDILTQLSAVSGALQKIGELTMKEYTKGCIMEYEKNHNEDLLNDLIETISRFKKI